MARLREEYNKKIRAAIQKEAGIDNAMKVPTLEKIVINVGASDSISSKSEMEEIVEMVTKISGQKPMINKAKKAISAFKIREGMDIGVSVTLRKDRMWEFFDKLVNVVLPRTKDFRGLEARAFDGAGNYSIGFDDHSVFLEIDPNSITKVRPLQLTIVTTAKNNKGGKLLLDKFNFPFKKDVNRS